MNTSILDKNYYSIFLIPLLFIVLMIIGFALAFYAELPINDFGINPRSVEGIGGIFISPFLHADAKHLFSNLTPALILSSVLFYFYRPISYPVFFQMFLTTEVAVWLTAREGNHIGASGIVYALASFVFFSGIIRKHPKLLAISLVVTFLYGGLVWGIFPDFFPFEPISWESHLAGGCTGLFFAWLYRKKGPQKPVLPPDDDEIEQSDNLSDSNNVAEEYQQKQDAQYNSQIRYFYKNKNDNHGTNKLE